MKKLARYSIISVVLFASCASGAVMGLSANLASLGYEVAKSDVNSFMRENNLKFCRASKTKIYRVEPE